MAEVGLAVAGHKRKFYNAATVDTPCTLRRVVQALLPAGLAERLLAMGQGQRPADALLQLYRQHDHQQLQQQRQQAELITAVRPEQQPALLPFLYQQRQELMQQHQCQAQQLQQLLRAPAGGDA